MPMYTYDCAGCGAEVELIVSIAARDDQWSHPCGGNLIRRKVDTFRIGSPSYVPGAITSKGEFIPGHFGKDARKKGGRYRP